MAHSTNENPVEWPARAVVTAGMPYGNKPLHFGHVGGVFVPADAFARFLRDRIGKENVRFVSGTDCFGSPINEGYRKLVEAGEFDGSISDYVMRNHERQANTLRSYVLASRFTMARESVTPARPISMFPRRSSRSSTRTVSSTRNRRFSSTTPRRRRF